MRPNPKPDDFDANDETLRAVDPLLNGTVTPTTVVLDVEPEEPPVIDYSKPLLGAKAPVQPDAPAALAPMVLRPAQDPGTVPADSDDEFLDEACVITLENDCSDPDSR